MPLPPLVPPGGTLGPKRAAHLLRRATFGATRSQITTFAGMSPAAAVSALYRATLPDPPLPVDPATNTEWVTTGATGDTEDGDLQELFKKWFIGQMMSSGVNSTVELPYAAREKIVLFLHTHFTCIQEKVGNSRSMYYQNQLLRKFALDAENPDPLVNFKELTVKISIDNAMLRLLDGNINVKNGENENYARELLELYSIGRGFVYTLPEPAGEGDYVTFTEMDVQAAAKVLTGWDIDDEFLTFDLDTEIPRGKIKGSPTNASSHDNTIKQFSARFGNATIAPDPLLLNGSNPTEESAYDEIQQLIDLIYAQPDTARNICWKIYRFFVQAPHNETDAVPIDTVIIPEMVNTLVTGGYKLLPVIEDLLRSAHFYEAGGGVTDDSFGAVIKSPIDITLGTLRFFGESVPDMTTQPAEFYEATGEILGVMDDLGMKFFQAFDVAGYEAYHQFPIYHRAWITPNYLANRYNFIKQLVSPMGEMMFNVDTRVFVQNNFAAEAPDARVLLETLISYLLPHHDNLLYDDPESAQASLTTKRMTYFLNRFLSDISLTPEAYWTATWTTGTSIEDLRDWLNLLFEAIMESPEYQLA